MNTKLYLLIFLLSINSIRCKKTSKEKHLIISNDFITLNNNYKNNINSQSDSITNHLYSSKNDSSIDTLIIKCPENLISELKQFIKFQKEEWKNVKNPFIATYKGNDFGDYHHINFEDVNNKSYDFGHGNNYFGSFLLFFNDKHLNDNPKYLEKQFKIFWKWKISSFPCCSGDYKSVEAYLPSITKLELLN